MKKLSVSIAIPAHNEVGSIYEELNRLLTQKQTHYKLEQVLVYSDGSTDETVARARSVRSSLVKVIGGSGRRGKPYAVNAMFKLLSSDVVVLLDADLEIQDNTVLDRLILPFLRSSNIQLSSGLALHAKPKNLVERLAYASNAIWEQAITYPKGNEMYFCSGSIRAFGKRLYKKIKFADFSADDAFAYIACREFGFNFGVVEHLRVVQKLPTVMADFMSQSNRFIQSQEIQNKLFDKDKTQKYYVVGASDKLRATFWYLSHDMLATLLYLGIRVWIALSSFIRRDTDSSLWNIATSTKNVAAKPRIIFSNYDDLENPHYGGGGARAIHEVAKRLTTDFHVTVVTGKYNGAINESRDGIEYMRVGTSMFGPQVGQLIFQIIMPYYVRTLSYSVWLDSLVPPVSLGLVPLFAYAPVVGLVHMLPGADMKRKYHIPFDRLEKLTLTLYKHFVVTTRIARDKVRSANRHADIHIIPNGIDAAKRISPHAKKSHILYVGRIEVNQKGLDLLIAAYKQISSVVSLPLVVAGSGQKNEMKKLAALVKGAGLTGRVQLVGEVSGVRKMDLVANAAAIVVPSRFETFSLVALEAMSAGIPLVTYNIDGLRWIPKEVRFIAPSLTPRALGSEMLFAVTRKDDAAKVVNAAHKFVQYMNWDNCALSYRKMIKRYTNEE